MRRKICLVAFGASYTLETRLQWKLAPCFLLFFYSDFNITGQWGYLMYLRGLSVFLGFLMGFSVKIQWGWGPLDGVSVGLVESQWGRLSMGMLQGVVPFTFSSTLCIVHLVL